MLQMAGRMQVLGTETAFEVLARANALAAQGRSIINLGIGQPDFPTPDHIVEAGRKALADGHHGYTPANGIPPLRAAVAADLFRRHEVEVSPDDVLVVPGGKVTMFFAIMMFGEPGTEILYPTPASRSTRASSSFPARRRCRCRFTKAPASRSAPTRSWRRSPPTPAS